ncbi:MAG: methylmalonyl Co-A mutase-associated GTPase MeaB [Verrucomicrobiia bacterium]
MKTGGVLVIVSVAAVMSFSAQPSYPEWADPKGGPEFAGRVMPGVESRSSVRVGLETRPRWPEMEVWERGIVSGDRALLARAITLVESGRAEDAKLAQELLGRLLPRSGRAFRLGITGVPGVGKSTLIEHLGLLLCERGHKLAVLAVDPSSGISGGSVLGDKTRMEGLARHANSFIRPSPTGGALGGVTRKSRETMLLCEAAGYDVVFVETVGVGQSEVVVHSMVDCFLVLMLAGAGDELQGIKKGILELADLLAVTKADGENLARAEAAQRELMGALHYMAGRGRVPVVRTVSVRRPETVSALWDEVKGFEEEARASGRFAARRQEQAERWFDQLLAEEARRMFEEHPAVREVVGELRDAVRGGRMTHGEAMERLRDRIEKKSEMG